MPKKTPALPLITDEISEALDSLSDKQARTIVALHSCKTITAAAKAARVAQSTVYRWLAEDEDFNRANSLVRDMLLSHQIRVLESLWRDALDVIGETIRTARRPETRLRAAEIAINTTMKARAAKIGLRIDTLEQRQDALETDWRAMRDATPEAINREFQALQAEERGEG